MRRVYYVTPKRKKLQQDILAAMKTARQNIDPDLLERVRQVIAGVAEKQKKGAQKPSDFQKLVQESSKTLPSDKIPVDKAHVLSVVMKFLELSPDNKGLQKEIRGFLAESGRPQG